MRMQFLLNKCNVQFQFTVHLFHMVPILAPITNFTQLIFFSTWKKNNTFYYLLLLFWFTRSSKRKKKETTKKIASNAVQHEFSIEKLHFITDLEHVVYVTDTLYHVERDSTTLLHYTI